ncbi:MAG: hypothetical protein RJA22_822 [Verrucomicrobiota bacterium]|jgi:VanZ family protein
MADPAAARAPRLGWPLLSRWLPVVLWCFLIYSASADSQSVRRSSRFIGPFVRWLVPGATDETVSRVQFVVRKGAHVTEYAVLALLLWRALRRRTPAWDPRAAWLAFAGAVLFALSDEWHQAFVPNRQAHPLDVVIDAFGAALALLLLRAWLRLRHPAKD